MSKKMTEADWAVVLEVFRASLPRRGAKGRDDRLFLEALHYFVSGAVTARGMTGAGHVIVGRHAHGSRRP